MAKRTRSVATQLVDAGRWRVSAADARARIRERDARERADTRTEAQRYLGDPPPERSALANNLGLLQVKSAGQNRPRAAGTRVDLWEMRRSGK